MKHIVIHRSLSILLVIAFLTLAVFPAAAAVQGIRLESDWKHRQEVVTLGDVLYVKPGASGDCTSWENACELQTALSIAAPGDEIWVAEGTYKPDQGVTHTSCQDIRDADSSAGDGDYLIQNGGNVFQVYCKDMAGTPKEYLTLPPDYYSNYSQYTAGGYSPGTDVRTNYHKLRLLPETLTVDISDQTFSTSTGSLMHGTTQVTSMPYGAAMDCWGLLVPTAAANINLVSTPFAIHLDETFMVGGDSAVGSATIENIRQVVLLYGGGHCGWIAPDPGVDNPYNAAGGPVLELAYILPDPSTSFRLKSGVALYGGFLGTETAREQRDWQAHLTVLSGDLEDNDSTVNGIVTNTAQISGINSIHVLTSSDLDASAVLDGFTITAGSANAPYLSQEGGGIYNLGGSPTLANLTFSGNAAVDGGALFNRNGNPTLSNVTFTANWAAIYGGGISNETGSLTLTHVTFANNITGYHESAMPGAGVTIAGKGFGHGGGIFNRGSDITLTNVTFTGNIADNGGGMYNTGGSPTLTQVTFSDNWARAGGGMYSEGYADPSHSILTQVTFSDNSAETGGGMYNARSDSTLTNVIFSGNSSSYNSGGMYNAYANSTLTNVTFSRNVAGNDGGGMHNYHHTSTLTNVTFIGNVAGSQGGAMFTEAYSSSTLTNAIVWGNTPSEDQIRGDDTTQAVVTYSDIEKGCPAFSVCDDVIPADPFLQPLADNGGSTFTHALGNNSPAIDSGSPTVYPSTDQRGWPRPFDGDGDGEARCDMGAYEVVFLFLYLPMALK